MRRTALTIVATVAGLVLLLQFKTHGAGGSGGLVSLGSVAVGPGTAQHATVRHKARHHRLPSASPQVSASRQPRVRHSSARPTATAPSAKPRTVTETGRTISTQYGPVQVRIVETAGHLTDVTAIQVPGGSSRSAEIAAHAVPILRSEALKANSARIDIVSGATYTSDGYAQSLQSAIDSA